MPNTLINRKNTRNTRKNKRTVPRPGPAPAAGSPSTIKSSNNSLKGGKRRRTNASRKNRKH